MATVELAREPRFRLGAAEISPATREFAGPWGSVALEPRVMQVLVALASARGEVVGRDELIAKCWEGRAVSDDAVNRVIQTLRHLSEQSGGTSFTIETIKKVGYRLVESREPECRREERAPEEAGNIAPAQAETPGRRRFGWRGAAVVAAALVVIAAAAIVFLFSSSQAPPAPPDPSIAVLAFTNMSGDAKNDYLAQGIAEDLLDKLSQVRGLRVAARTSSFSFSGQHVTVDEIGRRLHVRTVVEGSVQRQGDRVRIVAQLIDTTNGYHLWSHTYDRDLDDIFRVQDEICAAITGELAKRLLGTAIGKPPTSGPSVSADAYMAYLHGRFYMARRNAADMARAVDYYTTAIGFAPNYADAHAALGFTYALLAINGQDPRALAPAKLQTAVAFRLDPDNFTAELADAMNAETEWRWADAEARLHRLLMRYPDNADVLHFYGDVMMAIGAFDRWLLFQQRAAALDPLSPVIREDVAEALRYLGRDREAIAEYRRALALQSGLVLAPAGLCAALVASGDPVGAQQVLEREAIPAQGNEGPDALLCRLQIATHAHDVPALKALAALLQNQHDAQAGSPTLVAMAYAGAGDLDAAMRWVEKGADERDPLFLPLVFDRVLAPVHRTARWQALMQRPVFREIARLRSEVEARDPNG